MSMDDLAMKLNDVWSAVGDAASAVPGEKVYSACSELHDLVMYLTSVESRQIEIGRPSSDPLYSHLDAIIAAVDTPNVRKAVIAFEHAVEKKVKSDAALDRAAGSQ